MTKEDYFGKWLNYIDMNEMMKILSFLEKEYQKKQIFPLYKDIFKAFRLCPIRNLKCVFLGQDPYPDKYKGLPRATGLAFANRNEINDAELSPSLKIIKESIINFEIPHNFITFAPSLEEWANQGILLLNSALSVEMNKIGSHTMLWRPFISSLLKNLSSYEPGIVYVLFGNQAQTFEPYINRNTSTIIKVKHPAYYARTNTKMPYTVFPNINKVIEGINGEKIVWYKELRFDGE